MEDEYIRPTEYLYDLHWNLAVMSKTFDLLKSQKGLRICLFVDGLDEYEGDRDGSYIGILNLFKRMATSPSIKICLSSRPWLLFEDAFSSGPCLRLQDLTFEDIAKYTDDRLNSHPGMAQLRLQDPEVTEALVRKIVTYVSLESH